MQRIHISNMKKSLGQTVTIAGFVQTIRNQGKLWFLIVRDISGTVQAVGFGGDEKLKKTLEEISLETVVAITGPAKEAKQAPDGYEVQIESVEILSKAAPELPIPVVEKSKGETDQQIRLDWRWLDLRKPDNTLIFKTWTALEEGVRKYWLEQGYIEIHSPKLMGSPSESGAELFEVPYFDRTAYLAQSPQFYKQMAMASGFEKVFEVGPVFRADPSFTPRHGTEFTGYDVEISYIESHHDVMQAHMEMIASGIQNVTEKYGADIEKMYGRKLEVPKMPFPKVTMKEAKEMLAPFKIENSRPGDLSPEEEKKLSELIAEKYGHEFVFVIDYPITVRPFYHMRHEDDQTLTKSFDLLWNGLEITTGAQREHRYEVLKKQAAEKGVSETSIQDYLNFFKYGCPPHGGFGNGPARMMMKLLGIDNVRDVTYLYRGVKRLRP